MKLTYLKSLAFSSLILAVATTVSCGKSSTDGSTQPAGADPFIGNWNDIAGNVLTISISDQTSLPGYDHEVKYSYPGYSTDKFCKLTDAATLTCYTMFSTPDTLVYNSADSTIAFTTQTPAKTTTFYQPGKAPKDPIADFLHTFISSSADYITISKDSPYYSLQCRFGGGGSAGSSTMNLAVSTIDSNKKEIKGNNGFGGDFDAIYDISAQTLTIKQDRLCYFSSGKVFNLSK